MPAADATFTAATTTAAMLTADASSDGGGISSAIAALHHLKSTEPPSFLTPSAELSKSTRLASQYLFSSIKSFAPKSPFENLLTEGFDAEQIWQQIDLQSQPLLSSLRRQVRNFKSNPQEIEKFFNFESANRNGDANVDGDGYDSEDQLNKDFEGLESEIDDFSDDDEEEDDEEEEDGDDDDDDDEGKEETANGVEDRFLKINELEKYLEEDEAREYGLNKETGKNKKNNKRNREEVVDEYGENDENEEDEEDDDDDDELEVMGLDLSDEEGNTMGNARYEDFFGGKKTGQKKKPRQFDAADDLDMNYMPDDDHNNQKKQSLSTHEKEQEKLRSEIEKMEKANLEPKTWRMRGEVTAAKRPKNSALEVDLDFEHNVRPAPVVTEEVTASLEELIQERVLEGLFDDVQKRPTLSNKAPREKIELDENKSKKGLAELYEDEYAQKTGLVSAALTFSDEQKKEASMLFKKLCLKLDALSHFHFTPKPTIEDMSIQTNVPALAMEEIAPLAVSDAAMLAPEEVFAGKGDIKEETELTKSDRKRRRSNKKRKFKAESVKREAIRAHQQSTLKKRDEEKADVGQDDKKARYKKVKEKF